MRAAYDQAEVAIVGSAENMAMLRNVTRFASDARGSIAPLFALGMVAVIGVVGAAIDYSRGANVRTGMQAALDATALNLAKNASALTQDQLTQQATSGFNAAFSHPEVSGLNVTALYQAQDKSVTVAASGLMRTAFMGILGFETLTLGTRAVAVPTIDGTACVLALDRTAAGAVTTQGSPTMNLNGCSLYSNSSSSSSLKVGGSATVSALTVGVVGDISGRQSVSATNGISTGIKPVVDPYAGVPLPSVSGCDQNNFSTGATVTINPGVYCGGMKFNAGANVTFSPGIYVINKGDLSVNGGATLTGSGVTIVFTSTTSSNWPTATINGGATINLTAPTSGATAGIVFYGDRNMPVGTSFTLNGGGSQYFGGAVYLPSADLKFSGGASSATSCTQLIADTITFSGNAQIAVNCGGAGTKRFGVGGVRLAS